MNFTSNDKKIIYNYEILACVVPKITTKIIVAQDNDHYSR